MSKRKILVIEDEVDIAEIITMVLETAEYTVKTVLNPLDSFGVADEFKPDAILLDLTMPEMSGWEVYKKFKANDEFKDTPIAIVTAKSDEFDAIVGLHVMHADGYITKPFGKQYLIDSVNKLFR